MKKCFKKTLSGILTMAMLFSSIAFTPITALAAPSFSATGGWYESLYAEISGVKDADVTAVSYSGPVSGSLTGDDLTYLVRDDGNGVRIDIPGLKAGTYTLSVTAGGTTINKEGITVQANDRSGYAHFKATEGVGAYNNDGTPKDNAIIVYVTDENKNSVTIPGYGNQTINYVKSTGETWTRDTAGIGDILNNNYNFIKQVTVTDNHPLIFRFIGTVKAPENLTPYNVKDTALGGSKGDNGNLAVTKDSRNITLEGIGDDATIDGWGFTFAKSSTAPAETDRNFEVSNLTFKNYPEDGLAFQGHDSNPLVIERCWVHNNTFYPGYCSNPAESDKAEGDGSCDFKRGQYYTLAYNHFINCHKTNLLGSGTTDDQWNMTLHHNYYENVGSRQPLAANGNIHIYSTYFKGATSTCVDLRGKNAVLLDNNYYDNCKPMFKSRNNTCIAKSYNEVANGGTAKIENAGKRTVVDSLSTAALSGSSYTFPDGSSIDNFDLDSTKFYKNDYFVTPASEVPAYVVAHAGTLQAISDTPDTPVDPSESTTEATTQSPVNPPEPSGSAEIHNFDDGKTSTFYTITGNLATGKGTVTYNGLTISQCLKMESSTNISFAAAKAGTLTLVFGGNTAAAGKNVLIDGTAYAADSNGIVTLDLAAGSHTIAKKDSINLFYMSYAYEGGDTPAETTEATTQATTVATTQATTVATTQATTVATTEATTVATTQATTEATTEATTSVVEGVAVSAGSASGKIGESITLPINITGTNTLASFDITLSYDASKMTATAVDYGNAVLDSNAKISYVIGNGTIHITGANPAENISSSSDLLNITFTLNAEGTSDVAVSVGELYTAEGVSANATTANGSVEITKNDDPQPALLLGDANGDGKVDGDDVTHILQYVVKKIDSVINPEKADVTKDGNVDVTDAYKISKFVKGLISSLD